MKKICVIALGLFFAVLAVSAWAEDTASVPDSIAWTTLSSETFGFSLDYPADWQKEIDESGIISLGPLVEDPAQSVSVIIICEPIAEKDKNADYQTLIDDTVAEIQKEIDDQGLSDFEVLERGEMDMHGIPAYKLDLRISVMGLMFLRMNNIIIKNDDNIIYLSFSAVEDAFEIYSNIFESIKNSFKLENNVSSD